jgi:queuine tRNA-ribosyltransferase
MLFLESAIKIINPANANFALFLKMFNFVLFFFKMKFVLKNKSKKNSARAGLIETSHGEIETPIFMPVGTVASVKAVHQRELLNDVQAQIILGNTYHLFLRPGLEILQKAGGLHCFNGWKKPILTDSGGFQVFSLAGTRKIKEEGVTFQSHIDGSKHTFTPENVVDIQRIIGADIIMAFDDCTPGTADYNYAKLSMERTHRWLERGWKQFDETLPIYGYQQTFFPIIQGCVYADLRRISSEFAASFNADGYAIGGLAVGEPTEKMYEMIEICNGILPENRPRYLMGVGTPANILEGIARGVDMFDCVMPTRNGRNGMIFTENGIMNMKNRRWANDFSPLEEGTGCFVDENYTKAYLRHLFASNELLAMQIASVHNLAFYLRLVKEARRRIIDETFDEWKTKMTAQTMQRIN